MRPPMQRVFCTLRYSLWRILPIYFISIGFSFAQSITMYAEHFPPYAIDANIIPTQDVILFNDKAYGIDIEIVRAAYKSMGIDVRFEFRPWKRIMRDVKNGSALAALSCRSNQQRAEFARFSNTTSQSKLAFVTRKDEPSNNNVAHLEDLKGTRTVIVSGYSQQAILDSMNIEYNVVSSVVQGLNVVAHRNQDVFFISWEGAAFEAETLGMREQLLFTQVDDTVSNDYHVCFSKLYPNSKHLLNVLNQGLLNLEQNNSIEAIRLKYGVTY